MQRHENIYASLAALRERGIIRSYMVQGNMPGKRYTVETMSSGTRAFDTAGVESFILGAKAALVDRTVARGSW
jgi:hypothetical protein